jgi:hypothetical protein
VASTWEAAGQRIVTRRDGLVSQSTWLMNLGEGAPRFALLQDFYPASVGRRTNPFSTGEQFAAELAFYPGRDPLRAVIVSRSPLPGNLSDWPKPASADPQAAWTSTLLAAPWRLEAPIALPPGRIGRDANNRSWWQADDGASQLPLAGAGEVVWLGMHLTQSVAVWSGTRAHLLSAHSDWGRISFDA